jgi:ubiquinone biosynthesis protein COQ4
MQFSLLLSAVRAYREGRVGDAAAYKAAALGTPAYPEVEQGLKQLRQPFPRLDLATLAALSVGTFGHAYARFMAANQLTPLSVSSAVASELEGPNTLAVRYTLLHDTFHVLLGFDTSLAGELGVWSFVAEQRYSPTHQHAAALARTLYPLARHSQISALRAARRRGETLAHDVPCLIVQPIEEYWSEPLAIVRERLHIPPSAN